MEEKKISKFVGSRIKYYRNINRLTQKQLGQKLGVKHNTISSYESGTNEPESDMLFRIANTLNVSINEFFPNKEEKPSISYNFYPTAISAGIPDHVAGISESDQIDVPDSIMGRHAGQRDIFITRINGESMNRIIPDGSLIAVKPTEVHQLKDGDVVVYSDDGDYSVKRFYRSDDQLIFKPDSTDSRFYDYVTSTENENLVIHGKVVVYIVELN